MKKLVLLLAIVLLALYNNPTAHAQEVRLDSLWAKYGGVGAMTFSPDSKTLIIGEDGDEGQVTVHNVADGSQRTPFHLPPKGFADFQFTPDGKQFIVSEIGKVVLLNPQTFDSIGVIENVIQTGFLSFSSDSRYVAVANYYSNIVVIDLLDRIVKTVLNRPDQYSAGSQNIPYSNGKVSFSMDGKYIIGKYENSLVRWDWQNAPTKPEIMIGKIPNRAVIGFSPDKKYFVLQSNYLWDIQQGKQVAVEGLNSFLDETAYGFATTVGGSCIVVTGENHTPKFINILSKKILTTSPLLYNLLMTISPDSNYFAYQYGNGRTYVSRVKWGSSGVVEMQEIPPQIHIQPQPVKSSINIMITTNQHLPNCRISIVNSIGMSVAELYNGSINMGNQLFNLSTTSLSSGNYFVRIEYGNHEVSQSFIITK